MENNFYKFSLSLGEDSFADLSQSATFEAVTQGRQGNHLVEVGELGVPLVRTTTKHTIPANHFKEIHREIAKNIGKLAIKLGITTELLRFNNALIEIFENSYAKMKYHSDQALDLAENSYIALFSCYEKMGLEKTCLRKLKIQDKQTGEESEILLENNLVVLFSLATNTRFNHKIVLENPQNLPAERWLGITFRQSKTFIKFENGLPYFEDGTLLTLADEAQSKEFYKLRGQENNSLDFAYPRLAYTLSEADRLAPV